MRIVLKVSSNNEHCAGLPPIRQSRIMLTAKAEA
jgi:hypothetical protein